ncbi:MAG: protein kinase [Acidobacteria bacterium]|nr:protein kinase [Acidobacteriota bacterium]
MVLEVGARLGRYEVVSLLGRGGMGHVYRAHDTELDRDVAIKVLSEGVPSDPMLLNRFEREARLTSALNHPNIVTIYGIERVDSLPCIVMELVNGATLRQTMTNRPLPLEQILDVAVQITAALAKAHDLGIVHRDLKPQNVMITNDGLVKVVDFGLSTLTPEPPQEISEGSTRTPPSRLTSSGVLLGTSDYMSPEQASGRRVDFRSDQFSFGSILYEMSTGRRPFHRPTSVQTMSAVIEDAPAPFTVNDPLLPDHLLAVIERCLAKDPNERYASTQDLARDLKAMRDVASRTRSHSSQMTFSERLRLRAKRGRTAARAAAALVVAAAIGAAAWSLRDRVRIPAPPVPPSGRQQLAVLPFTNIGGDPVNTSFSDGLVEILTNQLTQITQLDRTVDVVPASDVRREAIASAREARRAFGVSRVITGSVQRSSTRVRVTLNLVDTESLRQLSARSIDLELQEVAAMQDGVVREVAALLGTVVPLDAHEALTAGSTTVSSAYDAYLQGRGFLQRYEKPDAVKHAIQSFQRALELDPRFALAHAGLGEAYWRKYGLTKDARWSEEARASCTTALGFTDRLAPVYVTLGLIDAGTGRYYDAIQELKRAVSLDPVSGDAYRELANAYQAAGKNDDAEATYRMAIQVRPNYWSNYNALGTFYFRRQLWSEAEAQYRRASELTPDNARVYANLGAVYFSTNRFDDAARMLEKSVAIAPTAQAYSNLGTLYFGRGRYADAARMMEQASKSSEGDSQFWSNLAAAYYWAPGERAKARPAYERALGLAKQESQVNPRNAALLLRMADCDSMLGNSQEARRLIERALALAPKDVASLFKAGVVYEQLGDRTRALEWIGKALAGGYSRDAVDRSLSLTALRADPRFPKR